jgi:hypothetical protein
MYGLKSLRAIESRWPQNVVQNVVQDVVLGNFQSSLRDYSLTMT